MFSQTLSFCDLNTTINPIISTEDLKQFFEVFVVEWHYMNILKDKMYYLDYKSEVKFWEDFITENSFPKSTKWAEIVENFLTYRYKDYKIPPQCIVKLFLYLHDNDEHPPLLQEIFLKELTRMLSFKSGENNEVVKQIFRQLSDTRQLIKVNTVFSKFLLDERNDFNANPINHFITWTSWDTFFRLLYFDNVNQIISWDAKDMLDTAKIQFLIASLNTFLDSLYILNHEMISDFLGQDLEKEYIRDICLPGDTSYRFNNYEDINETIHYLHFRTVCHSCDALHHSNIIISRYSNRLL